jgi:hypothetical protein
MESMWQWFEEQVQEFALILLLSLMALADKQ